MADCLWTSRILLSILFVLSSGGFSVEFSIAETIEITTSKGLKWSSSEVTVDEGDIIIFKIADLPGEVRHGLRFEEWKSVRELFEILDGDGQQAFDPDSGQNKRSTSKAVKFSSRQRS